jgi:hypothetical protein
VREENEEGAIEQGRSASDPPRLSPQFPFQTEEPVPYSFHAFPRQNGVP